MLKKVINYPKQRTFNGAQILKRDYFMDVLEKYLEPLLNWYNKSYKQLKSHIGPYRNESYTFINGENPCISMKTGNSISFSAGILHGSKNISSNLPYWGDVNNLRSKFL